MEDNKYVLEVSDLHTTFKTDNGDVSAVNGVSFKLEPGKTLGIVGESGSGKSVTAYSIMQILADNGSITGGSVKYNGDDITKWKNPRLEQYKRTLKWKLNLNYHAEYNEWELYRQAKERGLQTYRPPQSPEQLRKALHTIEDNKEEYDVSFKFCSKSETGQKILELLSQK